MRKKLGHVQIKAVCSSTDLTRMREIALETQVVKVPRIWRAFAQMPR